MGTQATKKGQLASILKAGLGTKLVGVISAFAFGYLYSTTPTYGESLRKVDRDIALVMLRDVRAQLEKYYYDPTFKGLDFGALGDLAKSRVTNASSIGEAFSAIAQFVLELDDSHTFFVAPRQTVKPDYGWTMGMVGNDCFVLTVEPASDAARQSVNAGDRILSVNGFVPTRQTLWRLNYNFNILRPQPGLHVELVTPSGTARELDLAAQVNRKKRIIDLTGGDGGADFAQLVMDDERLEKSRQQATVNLDEQITVLRVPTFSVDPAELHRQFIRAHKSSVLILDLRGNSGGREDTLLTAIGDLESTDVAVGSHSERGHKSPMIAQGTGVNAFEGRLFVLVDGQSASAAEILARTIQLTNRGTIIGDRTMGAVMTSRIHLLTASHGENAVLYAVSVTAFDVIMADGGRLEKVGVTPDFVVLPSAADLAAGRDPALALALRFAGHPLDSAAAGKILANP